MLICYKAIYTEYMLSSPLQTASPTGFQLLRVPVICFAPGCHTDSSSSIVPCHFLVLRGIRLAQLGSKHSDGHLLLTGLHSQQSAGLSLKTDFIKQGCGQESMTSVLSTSYLSSPYFLFLSLKIKLPQDLGILSCHKTSEFFYTVGRNSINNIIHIKLCN